MVKLVRITNSYHTDHSGNRKPMIALRTFRNPKQIIPQHHVKLLQNYGWSSIGTVKSVCVGIRTVFYYMPL